MKNLTWQNPEQLFVAQELINKVKSKCCGIKVHRDRAHSFFKKQINKLSSVHKYSEINFHLILFPVPDKTKIVNWFISQAKNLKNDADE